MPLLQFLDLHLWGGGQRCEVALHTGERGLMVVLACILQDDDEGEVKKEKKKKKKDKDT